MILENPSTKLIQEKAVYLKELITNYLANVGTYAFLALPRDEQQHLFDLKIQRLGIHLAAIEEIFSDNAMYGYLHFDGEKGARIIYYDGHIRRSISIGSVLCCYVKHRDKSFWCFGKLLYDADSKSYFLQFEEIAKIPLNEGMLASNWEVI